MARQKRAYSNEELALLAAIHAKPRDDAMRLVYADWLDENGQSDYAEVMRLQCVQPYTPVSIGSKGPPLRNEIIPVGTDVQATLLKAERLRGLLRGLYKEVFYPVPTGAKGTGRFFRGLPVYKVEIDDGTPTAVLDKVAARLSPAGRLDLRIRTSRLPNLVSHEVMRRAQSVWFSPGPGMAGFGAVDMHALGNSPLPRLAEDIFVYGRLLPEGGEVFRSLVSPQCPGARYW